MRLKLIAALSGVALASVLVASPSASADKPAKPAESGVVQRKDAIGGHPVGPVMTDVGGTMLPILVVVGWDDAVELCTDMRPVINGVEQIVLAPSGNSSVVVHNSDAPVLVFDVSAAKDEEDFIAKCKVRSDRAAGDRNGEAAPDHQLVRGFHELQGQVERRGHGWDRSGLEAAVVHQGP